jgi:nickel transport protein
MADILRVGLPGALLMAAICAGGSHFAWAHGIRLHVHVEGDLICGRVETVGGGAVSGAKIAVYARSGVRLGSAKTDGEGRFEFKPREAVDHRFLLEDGAGHRAEVMVTTEELPASILGDGADVSGGTPASLRNVIDDAVSRHVGPLHEKIDALQSSIRLHDILGGIGYIVGVTGLWFYVKARRLQRQQQSSDSTKPER